MAAAYFQLSETSFRIVAGRNGVVPLELGLAVTRWRKRDLDELIARLPHRPRLEAHTPDSPAAAADDNVVPMTEADQVAEALSRMRRRAGGG